MQKEKSLKRKAPADTGPKESPKKPFTGKPGGKKIGVSAKFSKGAPKSGGPRSYGGAKQFTGKGGRPFNKHGQQNKPAEKQDWNKMKQDKKELRVKRKERRVKDKDIYELTTQAKKIYEKLKW